MLIPDVKILAVRLYTVYFKCICQPNSTVHRWGIWGDRDGVRGHFLL